MRRFLVASISTLSLLVVVSPTAAENSAPSWEFLSTATIGADRFVAAHPEWDGRGVLIAICDSGVELGLPGLQQTSDGKPKILDAREFSDEGVVKLEVARGDRDDAGEAVHGKEGRWLYGIEELDPVPAEDAEILIGYVKEKDFVNNEVSDLNNNGRTDDVFGLVTFRAAGAGEEDPWVAFIDTNADGDLANEKPIHDFAVARESFHLGGHDRHAAADLVTYALNLWPDKRKAALYFDGNGHGTHVAGTAAGYRINDQEGYNGIAPGAQILALKIGNNSLSGGSTTPGSMVAAWRHAVDRADELGMPLVIQMSYGVASENEATADAERLINKLLRKNPGVVATVSAGNEGPGLSTVGLPAAADEVFAVGAAFARTTAELVYGIQWSDDRIFFFSSRGGELDRPTIMAPGFEASTAPDWKDGADVSRGTSMAAPQVAGAVALLYSASLANDLPIRRDLTQAALQRTARRLPGYGPLDQGPGMVDLPRAWDVYAALAARDPWEPVTYRVRTTSPEMVSGDGPTVFYRGDFYPRGDRRHTIRVEPVFSDHAPDSAVRGFYRAFDLSCEADWVRLDKPSTYIKQRAAAVIPIAFDERRLRQPGLYATRIVAYDRSLGREARDRLGPELTIPVAVAVPHTLAPGQPLVHRSPGIEAAMIERVYLRVPPSTAALDVEVELPVEEYDRAAGVSLYDPEGHESYLGTVNGERPLLRSNLPPDLLEPGVWELVVWGRQANRGPVHPTCRVWATPLAQALADTVRVAHDSGAPPSASLVLATSIDSAWHGTGSGAIAAATRTSVEEVTKATFERGFTVSADESRVELRLEVSPEDWGLFTDLAILVTDSEGRALVRAGFSGRRARVIFTPPDGADPAAEYTLSLIGATADPDLTKPRWDVVIREIRHYREPVSVELRHPGRDDGAELTLYPDHPTRLELKLDRTPPKPPAGYSWLATLTLAPAEDRLPTMALEVVLG